MKIHLLYSLFFISMLALACTTGAENSSQDFVYLGSELVLDELTGQKILPLHALITRITELASEEELSTALTSLAKRLENGTAVAPKSLALDAILDARDLLVRHNDQVASDEDLKTLNSQLEFYQTAIENDILTIDVPQAKNSDCCNLANGECAAPAEKKMATRFPGSPNVALYVTGSAGAMVITLGDLDTASSVDLISKAATGTTTVDGGTVNVGYTTATTVAIGKPGNTATNTLYGRNELPTGLITQSGYPYIHATGSTNFFAGQNAGNLGTQGSDNTGIGVGALYHITSLPLALRNTAVGRAALEGGTPPNYDVRGIDNTAVGAYAGQAMSEGARNTLIGNFAGNKLVRSTDNVLLGANAGSNYVDNTITIHNNNICIGSGATGAGTDSGVIRLGTTDTQIACYVAGVDAASTAITAAKVVGVGTNDQLVTSTTNPAGFSLSNPLTASGIIYANGGVDLAAPGTLNLGTGSATTINMGQAGGATAIQIIGGDPLRFINPSDPTKYVGFKGGSASGTTVWTLPTADGSAGQVLQTDGEGSFSWTSAPTPGDAWSTTGNPLSSTKVLGSTNGSTLNFVTDGASNIRMNIAGTTPYAITATSQILANGNIDLPSRFITASAVPYVHSTGTRSFFAGTNAGNTGAAGTTDNVGIGEAALFILNSELFIPTSRNTAAGSAALHGQEAGLEMQGSDDTAVGYHAGFTTLHGNSNTLIGSSAGVGLNNGSYNVLIGTSAGATYFNQSYNICIGTSATGAGGDTGVIRLGVPGTQTSCYMAGVDAASAAATAAKVVGVDGLSQLVTSTGHADGFTLDDTLRMSTGRYAPAVPYGSAVTPMIQYGRVDGSSGAVTNNSNGVVPNATPHPSTGTYVINYTSYGTTTPVIIATPEFDQMYRFAVATPEVSSCIVYIYDDTGTPQDAPFDLYIIGVPS